MWQLTEALPRNARLGVRGVAQEGMRGALGVGEVGTVGRAVGTEFGGMLLMSTWRAI